MRYWLMSMVLVLFAVLQVESQETKKADSGKEKVEQKEPSEYLGKSFDQWRADLNFKKQLDPSKREAAMKAVLMFGLSKAAEAIPDIIADLKRHPKPNIDLSVRVNGVMALNTYFFHASKGGKIPDSLVKEAIPVYKQFLKDSQVIMRERAVQGLKYLGPQAKELLDDVIPLAKDPSTWELRKEAVPIMVQLAYKEKGVGETKAIIALRYLADREKENSYIVRTLAVQGLGMIGHDTVLVDLKKALENDPSKEVRLAAIQAMAMGPKEKAMIDLKRTWEDKVKDIRLAAVQAYGAAGQEKSLPELRKLLDHPEKEMRLQAVNTIGALAKFIKAQPPDLTFKTLQQQAAVEKEPVILIWLYATMMTALDNVDAKHMNPVVQRLGHKETPVRLAALQVIAMGGLKSKPFALKAVTDIIDDPELQVAVAANETLVHMHGFEAIPTLKTLMENAKARPEVREAAETALDHFELIKLKEKNDKKATEKK